MMTMENIEKTCFSSKCTKSANGTLRNCLRVCMCFLHLPHTGGADKDGVLLAGLTGIGTKRQAEDLPVLNPYVIVSFLSACDLKITGS